MRLIAMHLILADTITPALTANFVYLFLMNALIGLVEAYILRRWLGGGRRSVWWMIGANYASAWCGFMLLLVFSGHWDSWLGPRPIERVNMIALGIFGFAFCVTIIVEWIPTYRALQKDRRTFRRALFATLLVNLVSYAIIAIWFLSVSYTLPGNANVVSLDELGKLPEGTLYFFDANGRIMSCQLDSGSEAVQVGKVDKVDESELRVVRSANGENVDLEAMSDSDPSIVVQHAGLVSTFPSDYWDQSVLRLKTVWDLRATDHRHMTVKFDRFRYYIDIINGNQESQLSISLPGHDWWVDQPTVLPDEKVLFQWKNQIVLFDPRTKNIAYVATGSWPCFVPK